MAVHEQTTPHHATSRRDHPTFGQGVVIVLVAFGLGFLTAPATNGVATVVAGLGGN